jgi:DHA2 family multidrug resistance protein
VFVQELLGFSATQTGLLLMPGGFATALMMPVIAKLLHIRTPPQLLNALGFILFFVFSMLLGRSSLSSAEHQLFWPMILRGVALSCLFVPLTTIALSDLHGPEIAQGTGLTNMMRQLGGSFGIALVATFIQHRSWTNRSLLVSHVAIYDPVVRERLDAIAQSLVHAGSSTVLAQQQSLRALDGIVTQQAMLLTYLEAFRAVGFFCLLCIPLLILLRRKSPSGQTSTAMH